MLKERKSKLSIWPKLRNLLYSLHYGESTAYSDYHLIHTDTQYSYVITWVGYPHPTFEQLGSSNGGGIYCAAPYGGWVAIYVSSRTDRIIISNMRHML